MAAILDFTMNFARFCIFDNSIAFFAWQSIKKLTMVIIVALMSKQLASYTETTVHNGGHFVFQQNSYQSLS